MDLLAHDCMGSLKSVLYLIYVYVQPIQIVHFVVGYHYNRALWNSSLSFVTIAIIVTAFNFVNTRWGLGIIIRMFRSSIKLMYCSEMEAGLYTDTFLSLDK